MRSQEKLPFNKPPLEITEQISLLISRRLKIDDVPQCFKYLRYVGYYRLSGYMIPFYDPSEGGHVFLEGTQFREIVNHYEFDRQLRLLCLDAIERIEVAFRALVSDHMSLALNSSHWIEKGEAFKDLDYHSKLLSTLQESIGKKTEKSNNKRRSQKKFIAHYHKKYIHPSLPPSWMTFETLSFGDVSFLFKNLHNRYKKEISRYFEQDDTILASWIHALCYLRNLCAHHSRLWNREMSIVPKEAKSSRKIQTSGETHLFFGHALIIKFILDKIEPTHQWMMELSKLTGRFPTINIKKMGFTGPSLEGYHHLSPA